MPASSALAARPLTGIAMALSIALGAHGVWAQTKSIKPPKGTMIYVVQDSDNLGKLSTQLLVSGNAWKQVAELNQLPDPDRIYPGQRLVIPLKLLRPAQPGAELLAVSGDVRSDTGPLKAGTRLAEGAQLQTGERGSATIRMADGSRVTVTPGSLAQIIESRRFGQADAARSGSTTWYSGVMRLVQGGLDIAATKGVSRAAPFRIETATATIGVRGTEFRVALTDPATGVARTEVTEGLVRADHNRFGTGADLPAGFGTVVDPKRKQINPVKLLDAPNLTDSPTQLQPIDGTAPWTFAPLPGAVAYRVQVARDAQFVELLEDQRTAEPYANIRLPEPGTWHVRARGIDPVGLEGMHAIKQVSYLPERLLLPALWLIGGKSTFEFKLPRPEEGKFRAVVATDKAFTQIVQQEVLRKNEWEVPQLKGGVTHYLKIESVDAKAGIDQRYSFDMPEKWGDTLKDSTALLEPIN